MNSDPRAGRERPGAPRRRVSARLAAIAESATLAVDAKAKALQAQGENVIGFGAGEPDFPTPAAHRRGGAGGLPPIPRTTSTRRRPACPSCARRSPRKTRRDSGFECAASQVLVTNGGKHAVFTAFAALCDPGDEVLVPAPYWTTYPEAITLAGGVPVVIDTTEDTGFQVDHRPARGRVDPADQGAAVRQPRQPLGCRVPARRGGGDRALGRRARRVGDHRRDLRAPHVRRPPVRVDADGRARARRAVPHRQRRRQDLRDDRLARRLDDRPGRCRQGGDQLPEPHHLQRRERQPARRARGGQRRSLGGRDDARGVRPPRPPPCTPR